MYKIQLFSFILCIHLQLKLPYILNIERKLLVKMEEVDLPSIAGGVHTILRNIGLILHNLEPLRNVLLTPISIHSVLTLLSQDPWFYTKDDFNNYLDVDVNEATECYKHVITLLNSINDNFLIANNVFYQKQFKIQEAFKAHSQNNFLYQLEAIDFSNVDTAMQTINHWVGEKTAKKMKDLVVPDIVDPNTRVTLLNTTHFQDKWAKPFTETASGTFTTHSNATITVEMMKIKSEFYYTQNTFLNSKILQLPFVNDDIKCFIVLPIDPNGSFEFSRTCVKMYSLADLTDGMTLTEVDVTLPKFNIKFYHDLKDSIQVDLESVFFADLFGIINEEINLREIRQKTFLDVNQEGLEIASGTVSSLNKADRVKVVPKNGLVIRNMNIKTDIYNRFAKTKVVWNVKNLEKSAKDATFKVVLPETAFITGFVMEIDGESHNSYVKIKEEAEQISREALAQGQSASLVKAKTRDSKEFSVSVNLKGKLVVVFNLTYEEMLQRVHDQYELVLNICPGQIVHHINIEVDIMETRPIKFVKTPPLRSGNGRIETEYEKYLEPTSDIRTIEAETASINYRLEPITQKRMAHFLGELERPSNDLSAQFIVQYDVERNPQDNQVLLHNGYFVHFFAPNDLNPLLKHVLCVLDTSGDTSGEKIAQLREAMLSIRNKLRGNDMYDELQFCHQITYWTNQKDLIGQRNDMAINEANRIIDALNCLGTQNIKHVLCAALNLAKSSTHDEAVENGEDRQPIIVFLLCSAPIVEIWSRKQITEEVTKLNTENNKVPIFSLSFGEWADENLRKLSLKNQGFSRHIYEAADASLQIEEFYKQISSPLLNNIRFQYNSEVEEVTRKDFPIYFKGSELVVSGRYRESFRPHNVDCFGSGGEISIPSIVESSVTSLERLWAYLTVKGFLDERDVVENRGRWTELTQKAAALALKYSFVTDVTSLVVVKPKETNTLRDTTRRPEPGTGSGAAPPSTGTTSSASAPSALQQSTVAAPGGSTGSFGNLGSGSGAPPPRSDSDDSDLASPKRKVQRIASSGSSPSALQQSTEGTTSSASAPSASPQSTVAARGGSRGGRMIYREMKVAVPGGSTDSNLEGTTSSASAPSAAPQSTEGTTSSASAPSASPQSTVAARGRSRGGKRIYREMRVAVPGRSTSNLGTSFGDKEPKEFLANRPFMVILQSKKEDKVFTLFKACVAHV